MFLFEKIKVRLESTKSEYCVKLVGRGGVVLLSTAPVAGAVVVGSPCDGVSAGTTGFVTMGLFAEGSSVSLTSSGACTFVGGSPLAKTRGVWVVRRNAKRIEV